MDPESRNKLRPKTGDLATPPRDRLVPVRDMASLMGCTEAEIERMVEHLGLGFEPLPWRGVFLTCLTLSDALVLHLAMRAPVGDHEDPHAERWQAKLEAERERTQAAQREWKALQEQVEARESRMGQWADRLNDLELIVAERGRIDRGIGGPAGSIARKPIPGPRPSKPPANRGGESRAARRTAGVPRGERGGGTRAGRARPSRPGSLADPMVGLARKGPS